MGQKYWIYRESKKGFLSSEKEDEAQEVDYLPRLWISPALEVFMVMWDWHNQVKLIFMRAGLSSLFQPGKTIWIHWAFLCCLLYGILWRLECKLIDLTFFCKDIIIFSTSHVRLCDFFLSNICPGKMIFLWHAVRFSYQ